jgi:hypothetical protein
MSLTLTYPKTGSPTYEVVLRDPVVGNEETTDLGVVNRQTRAGEAKSVRPADSPTIVTNKYQFEALTKTVRDDLVDFLENTLGLEIKLVDHNGSIWYGVIISPAIELITLNDSCSYNVGFDYVGVKQ